MLKYIRSFPAKSTVIFDVHISVDDESPDLRSDTLTFVLKKWYTDDEAVLESDADVSEGEDGVASFELSTDDTDIKPGNYVYEIYWNTDGNEYVPLRGSLEVYERVK
jgi:hypothetical protein